MKKRLIIAFLIFIGVCAVIILVSPYGRQNGFSYRVIKHSVEINAPVNKVFSFLGNSKNASRWSVFVHHINPINADSVTDGLSGSRRRCFCNADEKGMQWDELITEVAVNKQKKLTIYNLKKFPVSAENLATEQLYETLNKNKCRLTFTVFFKDAVPTLMEKIKMYLAAYKTKSILKRNMANIKRITEA